jgi:hypothetical protein
MTETRPRVSRRAIAEGIFGAVLLGLAFSAIAATDVSTSGMQFYWSILVLVFAAASFAADRMYSGRSLTDMRSALSIVLHWLGVLVAVQIVYMLVTSGRMANADTGLANGLILALGTFAAGAVGNWRLLVIGAALGMATAGVAFVEEYLWVLLGIAVLAILVLVHGARVPARHRAA